MQSIATVAIDHRPSLNLVARIVSDVLSPAALAVPGLLLGVWATGDVGTFRYAAAYFAIAIPLPLVYLVWLMKTGRITDFHLPKRHERVGPFAVASAAAAGGIALLVYLGAPSAFLAPLVAALAQTLLLFVITLAWQISIHAATSAGLATFAVLAIGGAAILLSLLVPLVIWSRLYLRRHTVAQVFAGAGLGCAAFSALFLVHGVLW